MDKDLRTEIDEAIEAADRALEHLYRARDLLHSARNWGAFDILAGGFISSLIKRGKMSDAQDELDAARSALATFAYELRDIAGIGRWVLRMSNHSQHVRSRGSRPANATCITVRAGELGGGAVTAVGGSRAVLLARRSR